MHLLKAFTLVDSQEGSEGRAVVCTLFQDQDLGERDCSVFGWNLWDSVVLLVLDHGEWSWSRYVRGQILFTLESLEESQKLERLCILELDVHSNLGTGVVFSEVVELVHGGLKVWVIWLGACSYPDISSERIVRSVPQDWEPSPLADDNVYEVWIELWVASGVLAEECELIALEDPDWQAIVAWISAELIEWLWIHVERKTDW